MMRLFMEDCSLHTRENRRSSSEPLRLDLGPPLLPLLLPLAPLAALLLARRLVASWPSITLAPSQSLSGSSLDEISAAFLAAPLALQHHAARHDQLHGRDHYRGYVSPRITVPGHHHGLLWPRQPRHQTTLQGHLRYLLRLSRTIMRKRFRRH